MRQQILRYYGEIHAPYLHAHGEAGTEFLLNELSAKSGECILEIGFGTGATLVKLKSRQPKIILYGLDRSETMLARARTRLKFSGCPNVILQLTQPDHAFPFKDAFFDKIYIESVLGIQEGKHLEAMLLEMLRVLKPGGRLMLNETVWLKHITAKEISTINALCKSFFGIIQASADYPYESDWLQLLHSTGFTGARAKPVTPLKKKRTFNFREWLSATYTFIGKLKKINPELIQELAAYEKNMKDIYDNKRYMEGILITATKE